MIEETEYTEEVRQQLLAEIASMKKQSLFSLVFTVACIIGMAYFYVELRKSRDELITEKQKVQQQKNATGTAESTISPAKEPHRRIVRIDKR